MVDLYIDRLKQNLSKELREISRSGIFGSTIKADKSILMRDFVNFWLVKNEITKDEFVGLCQNGRENELCNFIFGATTEINESRVWACDNFIDNIVSNKSLLLESLSICLKDHTRIINGSANNADDAVFLEDSLKNALIHEKVFSILINKIKSLNISISESEFLTSNTKYKRMIEDIGLSDKKKLALNELKIILSDDFQKKGYYTTRENYRTKDYLISVSDSFLEVFPDSESLTKWLNDNFTADTLKAKGINAYKVASFILDDQSKLTEKYREEIISKWVSNKKTARDISSDYDTLTTFANNCPRNIPEILSNVMSVGKDKVLKTLNGQRGIYHKPSFNTVSYNNNIIENLFCLGVIKPDDKEIVLANWVAIKPYIDEFYVESAENLSQKGEMYLYALEKLVGLQNSKGFGVDNQKLISKQLKDAINSDKFTYFTYLDMQTLANVLFKVSEFDKYISIDSLRDFYNQNIDKLIAVTFNIKDSSIYDSNIRDHDVQGGIKYFSAIVDCLNLYDGVKSVDFFSIKYSKQLTRNRGSETNTPLALDIILSRHSNTPLINSIIVGNEDKILDYKDSKGISFMDKILVKTKEANPGKVLMSLAENHETVKKLVLNDKRLTKKLYSIGDENITRILDKCKIENELTSINGQIEQPKKVRTVKI